MRPSLGRDCRSPARSPALHFVLSAVLAGVNPDARPERRRDEPSRPARQARATSASSAGSRKALAGEVRFDAFTRGRYATDASIYQIMPVGVAFPKSADDVAAAPDDRARARRAGDRPRRRHLAERAADRAGPRPRLQPAPQRHRSTSTRSGETATVEPGVVLEHLNARLKEAGLFFPVEPSTASRCTIGGMTGNNSCGARSLRYGKMVDNVLGLRALLPDGEAIQLGAAGRQRPRDRGLGAGREPRRPHAGARRARARRDRAHVPEGAAAGRRLQPRRAPASRARTSRTSSSARKARSRSPPR